MTKGQSYKELGTCHFQAGVKRFLHFHIPNMQTSYTL